MPTPRTLLRCSTKKKCNEMKENLNFYLLTRFNNRDISQAVGLPDYSYKFVEKYFFECLAEIGSAVEISSLRELPDQLGEQDYLFVFEPPHEIPAECLSVAIPVFAWEYSSLPNHESNDDKNYKWPEILKQCRGAVTHSSFTVESMNVAGVDNPKTFLHIPVFEQYSQLKLKTDSTKWSLHLEGLNWDSAKDSFSKDFNPNTETQDTEENVLEFTEVVYTYTFNPLDGRKRWEDAAGAFIYAHRGKSDAALILKLIHKDQQRALEVILKFLRKLGKFQCRVVVICGFLSTESFHQLIVGTDYVLNTSCGEGQCLPLIEFMSAGIPAISPKHTAMIDYVNDRNSFVVENTWGLVPWPNDERLQYRCLNYPVVWESLCAAYEESYLVKTKELNKYKAMSQSAKEKMAEICSEEVFERKIIEFIEQL